MARLNTPATSELLALTDQVAIVTGGAAGIGRAIALRLGEAGAAVVIADIDEARAHDARDEVVATGGRAEVERIDVGCELDARRLCDSAVARFGRLDVLVNNAGVYPHRPFLDLQVDEWERVIRTNLTGAFLCAQAAARKMISLGIEGSIVNLASKVAWQPSEALVHYSVSKGGVVALTRSLAIELARHGIRVNAIAPGSIDVLSDAGSTPSTREAEIRDSRRSRIPLGRLGSPDEIARAVLVLASRAADYMTGAVITVDGGLLIS